MKLSVVKGATSVLARVFLADSSSTTGAGLTGLAFNSAGLTCYRMRDDDGNAGATAITLATATKGTWATGGFVEKDATNAPGWYEFGIPNAALASGSRSVGFHFKGATNLAPCPIEIELTGWDNQDGVRGGLTALPNAAAEAAGGLYTRGTGAGQVNQTNNGQIDANAARTGGTTNTGRDIGASVLLSTGTGTGQLDFTSGVVKGNVTQLLGTAWLTPGTAGTPDVNVKLWNALTTVALPLIPTTAGRTLDVSAGGEAGVDWANVGSPTTTLALTGTTIAATQKVDVDTIKTNPVANAGTVTFPTNATLASTTNITAGTITTVTNQLTAAAIAAGVWTDTTAGDFTTALSVGKSLMNGVALGTGLTVARCTLTDTLTTYTGDTPQTGDSYARIGAAGAGLSNITLPSGGLANVTAWTVNLTGTLSGNVGGVATGGITAGSFAAGAIDNAAIATDAIGSAELAASAVTEIQSGLSTLTQTQVTGGAYAINSSSFAFNAALDFTTTQKAATLARVTLVDVTTTNADMRGTDSAALAATALSTATWTGGLATNLGTLAGHDPGSTLASSSGVATRAAPGDAMALTSGERTTLAGVVWNLLTSAMTTAGSVGKKLADWVIGTTQTGDVAAVVAKLPANNIADETLVLAAIAALPTATAIVTAIEASVVDGTLTVAQARRLWTAALANNVNAAGTVYYAPNGTTPRLTVTPNSSGRSVVATP